MLAALGSQASKSDRSRGGFDVERLGSGVLVREIERLVPANKEVTSLIDGQSLPAHSIPDRRGW